MSALRKKAQSPVRRSYGPLNVDASEISSSQIDLDLSTLDESSTATDFLSVHQDSRAKLTAARNTNKHYNERISELKEQIVGLQTKSQQSMTLLENVRDELAEENDRLVGINEDLPPVEFLKEQIAIMQRLEETEMFEDIDLDALVDVGVLRKGDGIDSLGRRIEFLINKLSPGAFKKEAFFLPKDVKSLKRKYIYFKNYQKGALNQARDNLSRLRKEVEALEAS